MGASTDTNSGLDLAWRLPDVRPQDDLFRHVNGRWLDEVPIPEDRASCGTLLDLREAAERQLREIVEHAAANGVPEGSDERKIGDLYASFLDEELIERLGVAPLQADLSAVALLDDPQFWRFPYLNDTTITAQAGALAPRRAARQPPA